MATTTKAKKTIKGLPQRKKFGDKNYTKKSCGKNKTDAKKAAEKFRKEGKGKLARVVQDPATGKWCLYTRG